MYRKARATALPINAGVPELRLALVDLKKVITILTKNKVKVDFAEKEKQRVQNLIDVNYKREKETYLNMFSSKKGIHDYVEKTNAKIPLNFKTEEDREWEKEEAVIDKQVREMVNERMHTFSFEIKEGWETKHFKEIDDVDEIIQKTVETYRMAKKAGKKKDANVVREKLIETKYAKEHLKMVMNMDFSRPTPKMIKMAEENGINLLDPNVIDEFRRIQ